MSFRRLPASSFSRRSLGRLTLVGSSWQSSMASSTAKAVAVRDVGLKTSDPGLE